MKIEHIRNEITRLVRQVPFRPFILLLDNGTPILIEHPENIAFDAGSPGVRPGSRDYYVISAGLRQYGQFDSISSITLRDVNGLIDSQESAAAS